MHALDLAEFIYDGRFEYIVVHINTYGPRSFASPPCCPRGAIKVIMHGALFDQEEDFEIPLLDQSLCSLFGKYRNACIKRQFIITPSEYSSSLSSLMVLLL